MPRTTVCWCAAGLGLGVGCDPPLAFALSFLGFSGFSCFSLGARGAALSPSALRALGYRPASFSRPPAVSWGAQPGQTSSPPLPPLCRTPGTGSSPQQPARCAPMHSWELPAPAASLGELGSAPQQKPNGTGRACEGLGPWWYLCLALGDSGSVLLQQLVAQVGDLLLDADHDVGVVLVASHLVGEVQDALLHEVVLPAQVGLDGLEERRGVEPLSGSPQHPQAVPSNQTGHTAGTVPARAHSPPPACSSGPPPC